MHEGAVRRSLAIIYEFSAPKKAVACLRIAVRLGKVRSTDLKSIREADKIFYGERAF